MATRHQQGSGEHYASRLLVRLRRALFGPPIAHSVQLAHRLPVYLALPVFASDALSSVAYATEEILHVLTTHAAPPGAAPLASHLLPLSLGIVGLMIIVALSYIRAITLYPSSGGAYTVARRNLGYGAGLVAAAALTIDYVLTVAVSASAGIAALTSLYQGLQGERVLLAILLVALITFINLRGVKESGWTFALPAYAFAAVLVALIGRALWNYAQHTVVPVPPHDPLHAAAGGMLWFVLAKAFSNGCSALTGVEAISNGVNAFQPPEGKNAIKTLVMLIASLVVLFLGIGFAAHIYQVSPAETETVISQLARANFGGDSLLYHLTIWATVAILMVAANTSFVGLPQLLALVAKDGYAPRSLKELGDRLVYNRGILVLSGVAIGLICLYRASVTGLIPLYAVGVFICFTLSQLGLAVKLWNSRPRPVGSFLLSAFGALVTGCVALVIAVSKFADGAWMVIVLMPVLCYFGLLVRRHYDWFRRRMTLQPDDKNPLAHQAEPLTVVVLIGPEINRGTLQGIEFARSIVEGRTNAIFRALHVEMDKEYTPRLERQWKELVQKHLKGRIKLEKAPSPYRWLIQPILEYLDALEKERYGDQIIVVVPEFETGSWFSRFLHNATSWRLRQVLQGRPHITIVTTRYFLAEDHALQTAPR